MINGGLSLRYSVCIEVLRFRPVHPASHVRVLVLPIDRPDQTSSYVSERSIRRTAICS